MNGPNTTGEIELAGWRDAWVQLGGKDGLALELATRARKAALRHRAYQIMSVVTAIGVRFRRRLVWVISGLFVPWFIVACVSRGPIFRTTTLHLCLYVSTFLVTFILTLLYNSRKERRLLAERDELETLIAERTLL